MDLPTFGKTVAYLYINGGLGLKISSMSEEGSHGSGPDAILGSHGGQVLPWQVGSRLRRGRNFYATPGLGLEPFLASCLSSLLTFEKLVVFLNIVESVCKT